MSSNHIEELPELRQMGAQLFVTRRRGMGTGSQPAQFHEVLLVEDTSKAEVAAGLVHGFTRAGEPRRHVFAGGRQRDPDSQNAETVGQTVRREWLEELEELSGELEPIITASILGLPESTFEQTIHRQQLYPFVVGQRVEAVSPQGTRQTVAINEVTATTVYLDFDELPLELRRALEACVANGQGEWRTFQELVQAFWTADVTREYEVGGHLVRPWLLTGAMIYHWQHAPGFEPDKVISQIQRWNSVAYGYLVGCATVAGIEVNNGNMGTDGKVMTGLPAEDYRYLGVRS